MSPHLASFSLHISSFRGSPYKCHGAVACVVSPPSSFWPPAVFFWACSWSRDWALFPRFICVPLIFVFSCASIHFRACPQTFHCLRGIGLPCDSLVFLCFHSSFVGFLCWPTTWFCWAFLGCGTAPWADVVSPPSTFLVHLFFSCMICFPCISIYGGSLFGSPMYDRASFLCCLSSMAGLVLYYFCIWLAW